MVPDCRTPLWPSLRPQPRSRVWTQPAAVWAPASNGLAGQPHCLVKSREVTGAPASRRCPGRHGHRKWHGGWAEQLWQGGRLLWRDDSIITQTRKLPTSLVAQCSIDSLRRGLMVRAEALFLKTMKDARGYPAHQSRRATRASLGGAHTCLCGSSGGHR